MFKSLSLVSAIALFASLAGLPLSSCENEKVPVFEPAFSYEVSDDNPNIIRYVNTTAGDHSYMKWDFGNGESTDKQPANKLTYSIFYPLAGDYDVELTIWGSGGKETDSKSVMKIVSIEKSAPLPAFNYEAVSGSPNYIRLTDTSTGDYDSISWKYKGKEYGGLPGDEKLVYLPMRGTYSIELVIMRDDISRSVSNEIVISSDDPGYLDHYELVWSDEFDGEEINNSEWLHETGDHGWGNEEWQNYTDGLNTSVSGGVLKITARKPGPGQHAGDYTSSRINSRDSFTYGRFEVRAKMPSHEGPGLWPAIWMLGSSIREGTSWPLCGEIDIMEYVSWNPDNYSCAIHMESRNHNLGNAVTSGFVHLPAIEEEYHVYGLIWTYRYLKFYIDDVDNVVLTYNKPPDQDQENWPFDSPFYFLFNIAVGGNYGGVEGVDDSIFPAVMEIDYARVYQIR